MNKWIRRVLVVLLVVVGLYVVAGTIFTAVLLNHLLTPGGVDWAGYNNPDPPTGPFELGYFGDPQVALGLPFEP